MIIVIITTTTIIARSNKSRLGSLAEFVASSHGSFALLAHLPSVSCQLTVLVTVLVSVLVTVLVAVSLTSVSCPMQLSGHL